MGETLPLLQVKDLSVGFTRQGDMIYGVVVIPDPLSGGSNT